MAVSSRIDRGYDNLSNTISFWPFFRWTLSWRMTHPVFNFDKNLKGFNKLFALAEGLTIVSVCVVVLRVRI